MFLDKYSKSIQPAVASEGTAFAQLGKPKPKGGKKTTVVVKEEVDNKSGKKKDPYTDMDCFNCGKKGHPARFCPNQDDGLSLSSKSSKSSMNDFKKQLKAVKKLFTQLQAMRDSDDSSSSDNKQSHFQYFQFNQRAKEP
jgi:hypothetical protein